MQKYNVDKDAFSALIISLGYTHKSTNADGEELWNAPGDKPGDVSLTIKQSGGDYNVHVFTGKAAPLEQGADYSFSDARKKLEGINNKELTRRLVNEGYGDKPKSKQQPSSFRSQYQFPKTLELSEDSLLLPNGEELKQDPLISDAYHGQLTGDLRENIAFVYRDSDGKPASLIYRIKNKNGGKSILQYAFNANSGTFTAGGVDNKNRRLFLEESARELSTVIFCEGEKCAYDLQRFLLEQGITGAGVTTAGGSNNIKADVIGAALGGKTVYILPDADKPGYACAKNVRQALLDTGATVHVLKWNAGTSAGYDISNLLDEQGEKFADGTSDLDSFIRSLETLGVGSWTDGAFLSDYEKEEAGAGDSEELPITQTLAELAASDIKRPPFVIPDLIYQGDSVIVGAQRGVGKTWVALELALSVATCKPFLWRFPKSDNPQTVLIVNAEMPKWNIKERFEILTHGNKTAIDNILFLHWDEMLSQYNENINLAVPVWQTRIEKLIEQYGVNVLIIDPLTLIYSPKDVSSSNLQEYATEFNNLLLMTRAHDCTLITTLHMGKEPGKIRGTSALEDMATLGISLIDTDDEKGKSRANFKFQLSKNRNGITCPAFTASLDNGYWTCQDSEQIKEAEREEHDKQKEFALEKFREGLTPAQIKTTEAGNVPEKGLPKLYFDYMPAYLAEQYRNGEPLEILLDKYEKPLVREAILKMYPHNYGAACVILFDAGDDRKSILQAYRKIKPGATEPPELIEAEAERTAQKNEERKTEYFKQLDDGLRIDELRKKFQMPIKLHNAYYAEWSADKARVLLQAGVDIRDVLQARLPDNRNKFDVEAVATSFICMGNDKQAALEELSAVEGIDRGTFQKVVKAFGLSFTSKPVGRPRKEKGVP